MIGLTVLATAMLFGAAYAEEDAHKIRKTEQMLDQLRRKAEELEQAGNRDEARAVHEKAVKLSAYLRKARTRHERDEREEREAKKRRPMSEKQMHAVQRSLGQAMEALRDAGRTDEAARLAELARSLKREWANGRERRMAEHHLEILRVAFEAFREAEKGEWAERMEHAIHVRELQLAGRRDEEARDVIRRGPSLGAQAELLHAAAELWWKWGHKERAGMCKELGQHYAQIWRKKHGKKAKAGSSAARGAKKAAKQHGAARDELLEALERTMHRLERLERRLAEVEQRLRERPRHR